MTLRDLLSLLEERERVLELLVKNPNDEDLKLTILEHNRKLHREVGVKNPDEMLDILRGELV